MKIFITGFNSSGGTAITEYSNVAGTGTLAGARNGANKIYTVTNTPLSSSLLEVLIDGVALDPSDWSRVGKVFTLGAGVPAPTSAQSVAINYAY